MPQDTHDDRQPEAECLPVPRKEAQPAASALIVREGQVILPETNEICPDDKAFEAVYATILSQEELPELLNALHARRPAYSLLQKGCFLVGGLP